jgi:hypothetical protein
MRIEYRNKFTDILLFNAVHQFLSLPLQGLYLGLCAFIFYSESLDSSLSLAAVTALLWCLALWVFQLLFNVVYLFSRKNGSVLTDHIVEVQADALLEETKFNKSLFYWSGVVRAVSRPGFVGIYVTPHMAHVIPTRAFKSEQERVQFIALVREKIRAAGINV